MAALELIGSGPPIDLRDSLFSFDPLDSSETGNKKETAAKVRNWIGRRVWKKNRPKKRTHRFTALRIQSATAGLRILIGCGRRPMATGRGCETRQSFVGA